ncbi:uncharacterized protein [Aegilops tauschii subsp. strangulata]|uniref:uncharacterized protein n=1 Tax=Aegilops tauschii subsp. strangulata TaxID=200361 RepID=UPI003CC8CC1E
MTVLSWNCRGLGQPRTVQELVCLVHTYKPKLVFLSETRQSNACGKRKEWRPVGSKPSHPFRYEHMWEQVESLQRTIEEGWRGSGEATNLQDVGAKISNMEHVLRTWAERDFGSVLKKTAEFRRKLSILWSSPNSAENQQKIKRCEAELDEILLQEELMWRQRSRVTYLREGDRNTKWFQRKATWRMKKNEISRLLDSSGVWKEDKEGIQDITRSFFQNLYEKEHGVEPQAVLNLVETKVTEEMNSALTKPFTEKEVTDSLFQIGLLKAPGPDGLLARFYQRNWESCEMTWSGAF